MGKHNKNVNKKSLVHVDKDLEALIRALAYDIGLRPIDLRNIALGYGIIRIIDDFKEYGTWSLMDINEIKSIIKKKLKGIKLIFGDYFLEDTYWSDKVNENDEDGEEDE